MGEISIQQAALTGSIKSSENLTCEIVPEGVVSGKMVSPDIVHEVGVETPATRDKLGLVRVGENLKITTESFTKCCKRTRAKKIGLPMFPYHFSRKCSYPIRAPFLHWNSPKAQIHIRKATKLLTTGLLGFPPSTITYGNQECMVGKRPSNSTCT